jgi:hypothetical protein
MTLTPRQQAVLDELRKPLTVAFYMPRSRFDRHHYWHIAGVGKCTREINALIQKGLVQRMKHPLTPHVMLAFVPPETADTATPPRRLDPEGAPGDAAAESPDEGA